MTEKIHPHHMFSEVLSDHNRELSHEEIYALFSQPQRIPLALLQQRYPEGSMDSDKFTVDVPYVFGGNQKTVYTVIKGEKNNEPSALKIETSYYKKPANRKLNYFDTTRKIVYEYDAQGYLVYEVDIELGVLGHEYRFEYTILLNGQRVLSSITDQTIRRQGILEPGPPIGERISVDFTDLHPVAADDTK